MSLVVIGFGPVVPNTGYHGIVVNNTCAALHHTDRDGDYR
eukprot:CAMPEP_0202716776 /NCGR_PEP_ID=MMETSP1385-20130828/104845_1 /ASSEMBLY_ACC=CAM_ASM_000861 /TAXON_ID=933848 /ORGANISM="Elphidium margaritaceum" /LENGTH=39 /DNA_ID= /DNA_START= /DNA_END= /DNA_ORIENTATION=